MSTFQGPTPSARNQSTTPREVRPVDESGTDALDERRSGTALTRRRCVGPRPQEVPAYRGGTRGNILYLQRLIGECDPRHAQATEHISIMSGVCEAKGIEQGPARRGVEVILASSHVGLDASLEGGSSLFEQLGRAREHDAIRRAQAALPDILRYDSDFFVRRVGRSVANYVVIPDSPCGSS